MRLANLFAFKLIINILLFAVFYFCVNGDRIWKSGSLEWQPSIIEHSDEKYANEYQFGSSILLSDSIPEEFFVRQKRANEPWVYISNTAPTNGSRAPNVPGKLTKPRENESRRDESPKATKLLKKYNRPPPAGGRFAKFFEQIGSLRVGGSIVARNGQRTNQKAPSYGAGQQRERYNYAPTRNFPPAGPKVREGVRRPPKESPVTAKTPGQNTTATLPGYSTRGDRRPTQGDPPTLTRKDQKITSGTRPVRPEPTVIDLPNQHVYDPAKQRIEKTRPQEPLSKRPPAAAKAPAPVNGSSPVANGLATRKETPPRNEVPKKVASPPATSGPASRPPAVAKLQMRESGALQRRPTVNDPAARAAPLAKLPIKGTAANGPGPGAPATKITGTKIAVTKERVQTLEEKPTQEPVTGVTPKRNSWPREEGAGQDTNKPLSPDDFTTLKKLGNGSFGTVYKVQHKHTGKIFAMKVTKMTKNKQINVANEDEIIMMRYLRSKAFNEMFDFLLEPIAFDSEVGWTTHSDGRREEDLFGKVIPHTMEDGAQVLRVVMPLMDGGDLFDLMRKYGRITEELCRVLIAQVIDFGLGKIGSESTSRAGTARYMAPEVVKNKKYGPEVDWYSIGAMIYTLMVGNYVSFTGKEEDHLYIKIAEYGDGKREIEFPEWLEFSYECMDVILQLMHPDPKQRLGNKSDINLKGVKQIIEHPWFKNYPDTIDRILDVENDKENLTPNPSPLAQGQPQKQRLAQVKTQGQVQQTRKETLQTTPATKPEQRGPIRAQPAGRAQQTNKNDPHGEDDRQRPQIIDYGQGDIYKMYKDYKNDKPLNANVGGNAPKGPEIVYDNSGFYYMYKGGDRWLPRTDLKHYVYDDNTKKFYTREQAARA
ncbi:protein kinase domain-containing protein [Ditylenchus destructor]|uniref:Serine/threonine-protein kinase greatwall n=1 Tax=Ditylenchus destructor TaxID=166010 RepID=A0AAD4N334_9BILA|nr:protein kinase domain-containing protein [Ditylenchus destructor]